MRLPRCAAVTSETASALFWLEKQNSLIHICDICKCTHFIFHIDWLSAPYSSCCAVLRIMFSRKAAPPECPPDAQFNAEIMYTAVYADYVKAELKELATKE